MALSPRNAAGDVATVLLAIIVAWGASRLLIYPALSVPDNAPVILRPITGFFVAWWLLHWRGLGWNAVGLRKPASWGTALIGCVVLYLANMALSHWIAPALAQLITPIAQPSFILYIRGNLGAFLLWLGIGIVVGGFMEECLFRGFLLNRVAEMFGGTKVALAIAVVAQAVLFGMLHIYGGAFAATFAALAALASGVIYLLVGRNLWPVIAVHATWNSVSIWGVYASGG
jgi:membrane protease YdiL (CAAX protease family)